MNNVDLVRLIKEHFYGVVFDATGKTVSYQEINKFVENIFDSVKDDIKHGYTVSIGKYSGKLD